MQRLKLAYLTTTDPNNKHAWSGTHFYILKTLRTYIGDVEALGPIEPFIATWIGKLATGIAKFVFKKRYNYRHGKLQALGLARIVNKKIRNKNFDFIIVPATSTFIPYLKTNVPIIYIGDATVVNSFDYHLALNNLYRFSKKETFIIE